MHDPIIEELYRHREDLLREHGNDPEALVRYLQEKERSSGRRVHRRRQTPRPARISFRAAAKLPAAGFSPVNLERPRATGAKITEAGAPEVAAPTRPSRFPGKGAASRP